MQNSFHSEGENSPYAYMFTVFTPTYNRAWSLEHVYTSLQQQTLRDFEWLIVDDGSVDNTQSLVEEWQQQASFPIRYIWQENQGKHIAFNRAVREARGELFLTFDSDDMCVPETLERFKYHWDSIPSSKKHEFSAVTCLCVDQNNNLIGTPFPADVVDGTFLQMRYIFKVKGEKWGFHRTSVLRMHPFPETIKQRSIPEGIVWQHIDRHYKTRFINERLRIYVQHASSLVHQPIGPRSVGGQIEHLTTLNDQLDYFKYAPLEFARSALHYSRFSYHVGTKVVDQGRMLEHYPAKALWTIMLPGGLLLYWRDKLRQRTVHQKITR